MENVELGNLGTITAAQAVTAIYIGYYDRAPDPAGRDFWVGDLGKPFNGGEFGLSDVATAFATEEGGEAQAVHSFFTNPNAASAAAFLESLYQNIFGRDSDQEGRDFWIPQIEASAAEGSTQSIGDIILLFIRGAQNNENGNDLDVINNKIAAAEAWTAAARQVDGFEYDNTDSDEAASAKGVLDGVDDTAASVDAATAEVAAFFEPLINPVIPGNEIFLTGPSSQENGIDVTGRNGIDATAGNDMFYAEDGTLNSADRLDGGAGDDALMIFNESDDVAVSPRTTGIETVVFTNQANDQFSVADNNVGGYDFSADVPSGDDATTMVDVEIDGGRMVGVERWEDFDSRADLVIEDARDEDDTDGTFTADLTVAMVSTDPGNVDYAVYFDNPTNISRSITKISLEVLDLDVANTTSAAAVNGTTPNLLDDSILTSFSFTYDNGTGPVAITIELDPTDPRVAGTAATYNTLTAAIQEELDANEVAGGDLVASVSATTFSESASPENPVGQGVLIFGLQVDVSSTSGAVLEATGRTATSNDPSRAIAARINDDEVSETDLITLNVELDDVGKGSMGGDAMFGAMSTGRQTGDDATSDSMGIQQFDIEVDRSSQLQTINSTNNSLEVVNIASGENEGPNNTTTAADEVAGDLVVRGVANPGVEYATTAADDIFGVRNDAGQVATGNTVSGVATDGAMPGALPQHNTYGFSDVRVINAAGMTGVQADTSVASVDLTAELTEEIVEKYLDIQDGQSNGEADDVDFLYTLGGGNDEFFLNMSSDALNAAGTGSREDFDMAITGNAGNDVITTNVGESLKVIDEQGQDHYAMATVNGAGSASWYTNAVSNVAAEFVVNGGAGVDTIWTHGWGDTRIDGGADADVIYTDNSGAEEMALRLATNIDRNLTEHDPIDYVVGGVWAFNGDNLTATPTQLSMTGATNDTITLGTITPAAAAAAGSGNAVFTVSYAGASGAAGTAYAINITIPFSELSVNTTTGFITTSEQALNQAIKDGINEDPILSNLLEAADGPGNSLLVATKTDGVHVIGDLALGYTSLTINNTAVTPAAFANPAYTTPGFVNLGTASTAESDNTIRSGSDGANDLFVLSTSDTAGVPIVVNGGPLAPTDLNGASNEVIEFDNGFGRDTVLNFDIGDGTAATAVAEDVLDFDLLFADSSFAASSLVQGPITGATINGEVTVAAETLATDTLAEIQAIYSVLDTAISATAAEEVVIVFDTTDDNAGAVYSVVNGTAVGDVQVAFEGTINLIGTDWTTLTLDNFA